FQNKVAKIMSESSFPTNEAQFFNFVTKNPFYWSYRVIRLEIFRQTPQKRIRLIPGMRAIRQIYESFQFAWRALRSNLMRTILSLLGVTVGIFAIITVLTFVDSLEKNIK